MSAFARRVAALCSVVVVAGIVTGAQTPSAAVMLYVSRSEKPEGILGILDPATGKILARVPTGVDPHGFTLSTDGRYAYVANTNAHNKTQPNGDSISIIDVVARKEIRRVEVGEGTHPLHIHAAGGYVYFTASGYRAVGRYDTARNKVTFFGHGQHGPHTVITGKDPNTVFASNSASNNIAVIEGANTPDWKLSLIPVGDKMMPEGMAVSPDGKELWVANETGGGPSVINLATKAVQKIDLRTTHANRVILTPDGRRALVIDEEGDLIVLDTATRKILKRLSIRSTAAVVTPDSSRVFIAPVLSSADHHILEMDLRTLEVTRRIDTGVDRPSYLAWAQPR
jgi:DNA-binding beta-propeller fold protein YncE